MTNLFADKTCIITGSSSGIGLGLAKELLRRGALDHMFGWRETNKENLRATTDLLQQYSERAFSEELDVSEERAVAEYVAAVSQRGDIDYLFANAGVSMQQPFIAVGRKDWEYVLKIDLYGVVHCVQAVVPIMLKRRGWPRNCTGH
jgi:NAD(P)-dependent dehydrogenase (short-subunit alcohol dehydrogenase family)